ncbi:MAG TPA: 30S ribosomal protein S9 [Verrucomicrobiales bacterium]|jgi:small subunit ribosomal protein S9|nr:30S ribosomal protein S9 [Verrucomicrobiales bacterium]HCI91385.1 30S ribosomal protein S9 [Verrucomicrobiales bacterium]HCL96351.1 30S ribosomal protein S9 [Verrucomicrobiales bacterium]|tara:strand:- start:695 stop:1090 length:396 start_codon:yes stop_codon:yes gene_type:complete
MSEATTHCATGRRKTSVARVWITPGTGRITINNRPFEEYVPTVTLQNSLLEPFQRAKLTNKFDVKVVAKGGGMTGQVGAIRLGISRALCEHDEELRPALKEAGLMRRDPRQKERKKYGQPGARKKFQFSKR